MFRRRMGLRVRGRGYAEIARVALEARRVILRGAPVDEPVSGIRFFENLNRYRVRTSAGLYALDYDVQDYPVEVEAMTRYVASTGQICVTLSSRTYHRLEQDDPRALFTTLHEGGHAILHCVELVRMGTLPHLAQALQRSRLAHEVFEDSEWQADAFASRFAVTTESLVQLAVSGELHPHVLVRRFGISYSAAEHRIRLYREGKG